MEMDPAEDFEVSQLWADTGRERIWAPSSFQCVIEMRINNDLQTIPILILPAQSFYNVIHSCLSRCS